MEYEKINEKPYEEIWMKKKKQELKNQMKKFGNKWRNKALKKQRKNDGSKEWGTERISEETINLLS